MKVVWIIINIKFSVLSCGGDKELMLGLRSHNRGSHSWENKQDLF